MTNYTDPQPAFPPCCPVCGAWFRVYHLTLEML